MVEAKVKGILSLAKTRTRILRLPQQRGWICATCGRIPRAQNRELSAQR